MLYFSNRSSCRPSSVVLLAYAAAVWPLKSTAERLAELAVCRFRWARFSRLATGPVPGSIIFRFPRGMPAIIALIFETVKPLCKPENVPSCRPKIATLSSKSDYTIRLIIEVYQNLIQSRQVSSPLLKKHRFQSRRMAHKYWMTA